MSEPTRPEVIGHLQAFGLARGVKFRALDGKTAGRDVVRLATAAHLGHLVGLLEQRGVTIRTAQAEPGPGPLVWATGRVASDVLADAVDGDRIRAVGTRARGGRMYEATQSGFWAAAQIGEEQR